MVRQITPQDLAQKLADGVAVRLLDVRQPWESQIASLPGSVFIPMAELPQRHGEIDADVATPLVVYCHHGVRSLSAAAYLQRLGFDDVQSLAGGIDAWSREVDPKVPRY